MSRVVLQVKGIAAAGGNPFVKGKKKRPDGQDPDGQETQNAADDPAADTAGADEQEPDEALLQEETGDDPAPQEDGEELDPDAEQAKDNQQQPDDPNPEQDQADTVHPHEWAGDAYEEGDETDPAQSFAAFTGQGGEEAWLDRADDGTITGWVRDADGTVYRYSDDNAWATDVDDAAMQQSHGPQPGQQGQDDPMQQQTQPDAAAPQAQAPAGERSLFDGVAKKDATGGGLVVVDQAAIAGQLAELGQPHLQEWSRV